jgi:Mrp family chromosome partitioning ATPase
MTGALLLVLRAGVSNREMAAAKLDVLDRLPIQVLGAVLNDARMTGDYKYYSYNLPGYELESTEPRWANRPALRDGEPEDGP